LRTARTPATNRADMLRLAAIGVVGLLYTTFATHGHFFITPMTVGVKSHYADLAEGYRQGSLALASKPDPRLLTLANPYTTESRTGIPTIFDASLYDGRYYLYFSSVPVLIAYLPVRLLTGSYPLDGTVAALFAALQFCFLLRLVEEQLGRDRESWVRVLLVGLGGTTCFCITNARVYEVAVLSGAAFSAGWAWSLGRLLRGATTKHAVATGVFLALTIASRPHLGVLVMITAWILVRTMPQPRLLAFVAAPVVIASALLMVHNYARFRMLFEFGQAYQMSLTDMRVTRLVRAHYPSDALFWLDNLQQYLMRPLRLASHFPFVAFSPNGMSAFPGAAEEVAGCFVLLPHLTLLVIATVLTRFGWNSLTSHDDYGPAPPFDPALAWLTKGLFVASVAVVAFLALFWWVAVRYETDFLGLLSCAALFALERPPAEVRTTNRVLVRGLTLAAAVMGGLLGFTAYFGTVLRLF